MANTVAISRAQLIYGICLPLAVLLGFFLADPLEVSTVAVVAMVLAALSAPLLFKWHHSLLILSWNASVVLTFLPGNPSLWMPLALLSLVCGLVNRSTDSNRRFLSAPGVTWSLVTVLAVTVATAVMTGGIGSRALGSSQYGASRWFSIFFAGAGYFAFISRAIPREQAPLHVALYFLPALTALAGHLIYLVGPAAYPLFTVFPANWAAGQAMGAERVDAIAGGARIGGFAPASVAFVCFLLARYGTRGLFRFTRPWRFCLFAAAFIGLLYSGYRSALILFALTLVMVFFLEGLHRTRFLWVMLAAGALLALVSLPSLPRMPYVVQRALAWLPVPVSPVVRDDVRNSNRWRVEMWKDVLPELPRHVLFGKGYGINPQEFSIAAEASWRGFGGHRAALLAGDYHNGPLSVVLPLGGIGLAAFVWFLIAGGLVLRRNCREGDPRLLLVNRVLYGFFLARAVYFWTVFGTFWLDLMLFTGLVGFGMSLNAELWQPVGARETRKPAPATAGYARGPAPHLWR